MDALLISFFLCAIVGAGDRLSSLFALARDRFGRSGAVIAGMLVATGLHASVAAWAGGMLALRLTPEARALLLALAVAAAGLGLCFAGRRADSLGTWRGGPFPATMLSLALAAFGESAPLLVGGVAAAYADPWMAGSGGWLGMVAGCVATPAIAPAARSSPIRRACRIAAAIVLLLGGFFLAMAALRLV